MRQNIKLIIGICVVIAALFVLELCQPEPAPDFVIEAVPTATPEKYVYYLPLIFKAPPGPFVGFGDDIGTKNDISVLPDAPFFDWSLGYYKARWDDPNYYRMIWGDKTSQKSDDGIVYTIEDMARYDANSDIRHDWLIFNEPDVLSQSGRVFWDRPEYAAQFFSDTHDMITTLDPKARFYVGGLVWISSAESRQWWRRFIAELDKLDARQKVDGVHIHLYPNASTAKNRNAWDDCGWCVGELKSAARRWYNEMHRPYFGDKPIIVTETGLVKHCGDQEQSWDKFYYPMIDWMKSQRDYDGLMFYVTNDYAYSGNNFSCAWLLDRDNKLTYLGRRVYEYMR